MHSCFTTLPRAFAHLVGPCGYLPTIKGATTRTNKESRGVGSQLGKNMERQLAF